MNNVQEILASLQNIDGFVAAALVDSDSGMAAGTLGGGAGFDIDVAAAMNSDVYRAKRRAMQALNLSESIKDILITLDSQYHLICPLDAQPGIFFYLALQRDRSNLAMARIKINEAASKVKL